MRRYSRSSRADVGHSHIREDKYIHSSYTFGCTCFPSKQHTLREVEDCRESLHVTEELKWAACGKPARDHLSVRREPRPFSSATLVAAQTAIRFNNSTRSPASAREQAGQPSSKPKSERARAVEDAAVWAPQRAKLPETPPLALFRREKQTHDNDTTWCARTGLLT